MSIQLEVDYELADKITVTNLTDCRDTLIADLKNHEAGQWMHRDDVKNHKKLIKALNRIITHFGGSDES